MLRRKLRRDLRRQRAQFGAVALTVMLGVALFGATFEAYRGLRSSYRGGVRALPVREPGDRRR